LPAIEAHAEDLALMLEAADKAADIAMSFFRNDPDVWYKNEGRSPVSEADVAIDSNCCSVYCLAPGRIMAGSRRRLRTMNSASLAAGFRG
jgi:hypothetical protein